MKLNRRSFLGLLGGAATAAIIAPSVAQVAQVAHASAPLYVPAERLDMGVPHALKPAVPLIWSPETVEMAKPALHWPQGILINKHKYGAIRFEPIQRDEDVYLYEMRDERSHYVMVRRKPDWEFGYVDPVPGQIVPITGRLTTEDSLRAYGLLDGAGAANIARLTETP